MLPQVMTNSVEDSAMVCFTYLTPPPTPNICCLQTVAVDSSPEPSTLQDVAVSGNAESTAVQGGHETETNRNIPRSFAEMQGVFTLSSEGYVAYFLWC